MTKLSAALILLTLVSCSNSYGSREEASNVKNEWLRDGVTIGVYPPSNLFRGYTEQSTRWCDEETRQFVCKKKLASSQKMEKKEWDNAKIYYSYFRY